MCFGERVRKVRFDERAFGNDTGRLSLRIQDVVVRAREEFERVQVPLERLPACQTQHDSGRWSRRR